MMSNPTDWTRASEPFRVTTSHFSGVVTMSWVATISRFVSCMSPVYSRTWMPSGASDLENLATSSCASAFIGAMYTILSRSRLKTPFSTQVPTCCIIASTATFVLPAPVGAHTSMFSFEWSAVPTTALCSSLSAFTPLNANLACSGSSEIATRRVSFRSSFFAGGTVTCSHPCGKVRRTVPSGSARRPPLPTAPDRSSRMASVADFGSGAAAAEIAAAAGSKPPAASQESASSAASSLSAPSFLFCFASRCCSLRCAFRCACADCDVSDTAQPCEPGPLPAAPPPPPPPPPPSPPPGAAAASRRVRLARIAARRASSAAMNSKASKPSMSSNSPWSPSSDLPPLNSFSSVAAVMSASVWLPPPSACARRRHCSRSHARSSPEAAAAPLAPALEELPAGAASAVADAADAACSARRAAPIAAQYSARSAASASASPSIGSPCPNSAVPAAEVAPRSRLSHAASGPCASSIFFSASAGGPPLPKAAAAAAADGERNGASPAPSSRFACGSEPPSSSECSARNAAAAAVATSSGGASPPSADATAVRSGGSLPAPPGSRRRARTRRAPARQSSAPPPPPARPRWRRADAASAPRRRGPQRAAAPAPR